MADPERRKLHPMAALLITASVAGILAFLLIRQGSAPVRSPATEVWFRNVGGRALYLDEPPSR